MPRTTARPQAAATPATTTDAHAHASATAGRPRSVVLALAAVLLLAAGLLLPAGGPAAAAPALPAESLNPADLAQALVGDWVSAGDGRSASAQLPGGTGTVRVDAGARDRSLGARTSQIAGSQSAPIVQITSEAADRIDPTTARCLIDAAASPATPPVLGMIVECGTKTVTISFDRPVTDPVLWLSTGSINSGGAPGSSSSQCTNTWMNTTVAAVDGSVPAADRLALVSRSTTVASFDGGTLTHTWQTDPSTCAVQVPNPRGYPAVRIDGVVESMTLDLEHVVQITRMPTDLARFSGATVPQADYAITVSTDVVDLQTTVEAPATVAPGGAFEWAVDVTNLSTLGSHGLVLRGAVPEGVTDAVVVDAPEGCVLTGRDLVCSVAPAGWTVTQNGSVPTLADLAGGDRAVVPDVLAGGGSLGRVVLRGTAPTGPGTEIVTTASVAGVDADLDTVNNAAEAVTVVEAPEWTISKTVQGSDDAVYPAPGDTLTYTVTATSTSGVVTDAVLTDDLTDVLADADLVPGSVRSTVGTSPEEQLPDPTPAEPVLVAGPMTIPAGGTATLTYDVVLHEDAWSTELTNTVTGTGPTAPATCAADDPDVDPACSTSTRVTSRLDLLKQGQVNGVLVGLDGAAFEVLTDEAGTPGAVLATPVVSPVAGRPGGFEIAGIDPGTYWLRETAAPAGHELLAAPVRFEVAADGTATVLDAGSAQVVASGGTFTVTDVPTLAMPETGSTGRTPLLVVGFLLLAGAGLALRGLPNRRSKAGGARTVL